MSGLLTTQMGAQGLFVGMITAVVFGSLFCWLSKIDQIKIKMPPSVPSGISQSFNVMIPVFIVLVVSAIFGLGFQALIRLLHQRLDLRPYAGSARGGLQDSGWRCHHRCRVPALLGSRYPWRSHCFPGAQPHVQCRNRRQHRLPCRWHHARFSVHYGFLELLRCSRWRWYDPLPHHRYFPVLQAR